MKVWVATSGEYSDFRIEHVFAHREDAESYAGADQAKEYEVYEGPVEMRPWHTLTWNPDLGDRERTSLALENPYEQSWPKDFDGRPEYAVHYWAGPPERTGPVLQVEGWDPRRVRKVYSEQRAQYLASVRPACSLDSRGTLTGARPGGNGHAPRPSYRTGGEPGLCRINPVRLPG